MGRMAIRFSMGLALLSVFFSLIAVLLPFNSLDLCGLEIIYLGSINIRLLWATIDVTGGDYCITIGRKLKWTRDWCDDMRWGLLSLEDLSARFCLPRFSNLFSHSCDFGHGLFALGLAVFIICLANSILQVTAALLINHYMTKSPKKQYRKTCYILVVLGTVLLAISLGAWYGLVTFHLEQITVRPPGNLVINTIPNLSTDTGYIFLCISFIIQVVQIILYKFAKIGDEVWLIEAKEQHELEMELAGVGGLGLDAYSAGSDGASDRRAARARCHTEPVFQVRTVQRHHTHAGTYGFRPSRSRHQDEECHGYDANPYGARAGSAAPGASQLQQIPTPWGAVPRPPMIPVQYIHSI